MNHKFFTLLISSFILVSCTSLSFRSKGKIPISLVRDRSHKEIIDITISKPFFLWGLVPTKQVLYIDEELRDKEYSKASGLRISERTYPWNAFLSVITLGMIIPKTYRIQGFSDY